MARRGDIDPGELEVGRDHVKVRLPKEHHHVVAKILHQENDAQGRPVRLVLDRYVQREHDTAVGEWSLTGAVTTELTRMGGSHAG